MMYPKIEAIPTIARAMAVNIHTVSRGDRSAIIGENTGWKVLYWTLLTFDFESIRLDWQALRHRANCGQVVASAGSSERCPHSFNTQP